MDLLELATRFTINGLHVERGTTGNWWITDGSSYYNHQTGEWDFEYAARHADDKTAYFTSRDEAIAKAKNLTS
jgi:hypothetical protein